MPLLIPVAKNKAGETVTPTCSKGDRPFTCLGCSKPLVLRQGEIKRWHFAHHSRTMMSVRLVGRPTSTWRPSCCQSHTSPGSTSPQSVAACVTQWKSSTTGARRHRSIVMTGYTPRMWPFCAPGSWRLSLRSWRRTRPMENRWRPELSVWEVEAMGVWRQQKRLTLTTDTIHVPSLLSLKDCAECARESRESHERREKLMAVEKQESEDYRRQHNERVKTTVVIKDDNTLLRNGVLMKRFFTSLATALTVVTGGRGLP
ncbi:unnamed protein product, partial [Pylaiella littoralis]